MKVERKQSEVTYVLELTALEYSDLKTSLYWARDCMDFGGEWRKRVNSLYGEMNSGV